jgi:hypothetical protein
MVLATLGARAEAPAGPLAPDIVLDKYERALAKVKYPTNISFEYSVEQLGLRTMEQTHRIYRSGLKERDETLVVDGYHLKAPTVRIIESRTNRYEIGRVAPHVAAYVFAYTGPVNESDSYGYVFTTQAREETPFAITQVEIDGRTFLPRSLRFRIAGPGAHGSGELFYDQVEKYWVVVSADVSAHLEHGEIAHETLTWSEYHFPASLPDSTFDSPGEASALPDASPLATAAPPLTPAGAAPPSVP